MLSIAFVLVIFCLGSAAGQTDVSLPRKDALIGLWPLNAYYKYRDISGNKFDGTGIQSKVDTSAGPFGDPQSAYINSAADNQKGIFKVQNDPVNGRNLSLNSSFTISFFVKVPTTMYASMNYYDMLYFYNDKDALSTKQFGINYIITDSGYRGHLQRMGFDTALSKVQIDTEVWNFHAFTFNASTCMLTTYNRFGKYQSPQYEPNICKSLAYNNNGFVLGGRQVIKPSVPSGYFHFKMSVSCLAMFNDELTGDEVMAIYDSCRVILGGAPCGTPRLPGVPFPASLPPTTTRRGQFPYLAALYYKNKFQCSAVVVSDWWFLTAASCIQNGTSEWDYKMGVGLYDLATVATQLGVGGYFIHPNFVNNTGRYENDIALVHVYSPTDFGNPYINDICMPWSWYRGYDAGATTLYFAGWGLNGRSSLVSDTAQRYTAGKKLSSCSSNWGSSFVTDKMTCMLSDYDSSVPCAGDEGGPLTLTSQATYANRAFLNGVYSFRDAECNNTARPPIFTNIKPYLPWIYSKIGCSLPYKRTFPTACPLTS